MQRSKAEIYLHFVWSTHRRMPLVTPDIEGAVYGLIHQEANLLGCDVLALGGMPDHVHLALKAPTSQSPAHLMQRIKGISSTAVRQRLLPGSPFGWQDNYAVFSLSPTHRRRVVRYIRDQKTHHGAGRLWPACEETEETLV